MLPYNKTLKNIILSVIISASAVLPSYAQNDETDVKETKNIKKKPETEYSGLGITAGYLSAVGLTYRKFFTDKFGAKITGIGFFDQSQVFGALGLEGMWVISENDWLRFYGLAGVSNFTMKRNNYYDYSTPVSSYDTANKDYVYIPPKGYSSYETYNSVGAGIGIELGRREQGLTFAIELPWILSFKNTSVNSFYPIPAISLLYNF